MYHKNLALLPNERIFWGMEQFKMFLMRILPTTEQTFTWTDKLDPSIGVQLRDIPLYFNINIHPDQGSFTICLWECCMRSALNETWLWVKTAISNAETYMWDTCKFQTVRLWVSNRSIVGMSELLIFWKFWNMCAKCCVFMSTEWGYFGAIASMTSRQAETNYITMSTQRHKPHHLHPHRLTNLLDVVSFQLHLQLLPCFNNLNLW